MEADSTTYDKNLKSSNDNIHLPFNSSPANLKLYKGLINNNVERSLESQLVWKLQHFGLIPSKMTCPKNSPDCKVLCKSARVIDRVQWVCEGCGKKLPIRSGSFFFKLQCSILQVLQVILAWCEDADITVSAQHFDIKPRVVNSIYNKLNNLAIKELYKTKLGGEYAVVLSEMYPDCLNRLSPDTTVQPHVHRILMIADTKHVPTHYRLHVIKNEQKNITDINQDQNLKYEVYKKLLEVTEAQSTIIMGNNMPLMENTVPLQQLLQHCDVDMQHFLSTQIWSQALTLCSASRELCTGELCTITIQRYLDTALYRLRGTGASYEHMLRRIADEFCSAQDLTGWCGKIGGTVPLSRQINKRCSGARLQSGPRECSACLSTLADE